MKKFFSRSREPKKPTSSFNVRRPPSSEWVYGAWVGPQVQNPNSLKARVEEEKKRSERDRQASNTNFSRKLPDARPQPRHTDNRERERRQPPRTRRERPRQSGTAYPTLAEIEAHERRGPRGANERYDSGTAEVARERYEPALQKVVGGGIERESNRGRKENTLREKGEAFIKRFEGTDPLVADVGKPAAELIQSRPSFKSERR